MNSFFGPLAAEHVEVFRFFAVIGQSIGAGFVLFYLSYLRLYTIDEKTGGTYFTPKQLVTHIFILSSGGMFIFLAVPFLVRCLILYNELMIKGILFA